MVKIQNEHWERNTLEKTCAAAMDAKMGPEEANMFYKGLELGILADICDNLTVIANILYSKGGK